MTSLESGWRWAITDGQWPYILDVLFIAAVVLVVAAVVWRETSALIWRVRESRDPGSAKRIARRHRAAWRKVQARELAEMAESGQKIWTPSRHKAPG